MNQSATQHQDVRLECPFPTDNDSDFERSGNDGPMRGLLLGLLIGAGMWAVIVFEIWRWVR